MKIVDRMPHVTKTQGSFISDHKTIDRRDKGHEPPRKTTIPFHFPGLPSRVTFPSPDVCFFLAMMRYASGDPKKTRPLRACPFTRGLVFQGGMRL